MHEHLDEFGLINMNGRMYDPKLCTFISPDPQMQAPDYWLNHNRYAYCLNNPLKYNDPDGEFWHIVIGATIGGVVNLVANWDDIDNFGEGLTSFGVGALAGGVTAATGGLSADAAMGIAFGCGAGVGVTNNIIHQNNGSNIGIDWGEVGLCGIVGGVSGLVGHVAGQWAANNLGSAVIQGCKITSPVISSGINGMIGGAVGGAAGGFTSGWLFSGFDLEVGLQGAKSGFITGGVIGVGSGLSSEYLNAKFNDINPWTGKSIKPKYNFTPTEDPVDGNITLYRALSGNENPNSDLFMTFDSEYAAEYAAKYGKDIVKVTIPNSTLYDMVADGQIVYLKGTYIGGSSHVEVKINPSLAPEFIKRFEIYNK